MCCVCMRLLLSTQPQLPVVSALTSYQSLFYLASVCVRELQYSCGCVAWCTELLERWVLHCCAASVRGGNAVHGRPLSWLRAALLATFCAERLSQGHRHMGAFVRVCLGVCVASCNGVSVHQTNTYAVSKCCPVHVIGAYAFTGGLLGWAGGVALPVLAGGPLIQLPHVLLDVTG